MFGRTCTAIAIVALGGALAAPAQAPRVDHVWLSLDRTRVGDGWSLTTSVTSPDFDPARKEILGVTLARARSGASARELHALRAHLTRPAVSFDGRRGRWRTEGGSVAVDMSIRTTGEAVDVPVGESLPFACRGAFVRVPVALTGTFAVRTGAKAFRTIELRRFRGVVTFNRGGPVECVASVPSRCDPGAFLSASSASPVGLDVLSIDRRLRTLVLQFTRTTWSHVLVVSRVDALEGDPPRMLVRAPPEAPVTGRAVFEAVRTTESVDAGCRVRTTEGAWSGTLQVRFSAWGVRTFGTTSTRRPVRAVYRESTPE